MYEERHYVAPDSEGNARCTLCNKRATVEHMVSQEHICRRNESAGMTKLFGYTSCVHHQRRLSGGKRTMGFEGVLNHKDFCAYWGDAIHHLLEYFWQNIRGVGIHIDNRYRVDAEDVIHARLVAVSYTGTG